MAIRKMVLFAIALVVALLGSLFPAPAADANYIVGATSDTGCGQLNMMPSWDSTLHYQKVSLKANVSSAVSWVANQRVKPTDLHAVEVYNSSADVRYYDSYWDVGFCGKNWKQSPTGGGVVGTSQCMLLVSSFCDQHRVLITNHHTDGLSWEARRTLLCHETGHVFGISHNYHVGNHDSCMKTPASSGVPKYSLHEVNDMINFVW